MSMQVQSLDVVAQPVVTDSPSNISFVAPFSGRVIHWSHFLQTTAHTGFFHHYGWVLLAADVLLFITLILTSQITSLYLGMAEKNGVVAPVMLTLSALQILAVQNRLGLYPGLGIPLIKRLQQRWSVSAAILFSSSLIVCMWHIQDGLIVLAMGIIYLLCAPLVEDICRSLLHAGGIWGKPVRLKGDPSDCRSMTLLLKQNWQLGLKPIVEASICDDVDSSTILSAHDLQLWPPAQSYTPTQPTYSMLQLRLKRLLDLTLTSIVAVLALPLVVVVAVFILIIDGRPIFYSQYRRGFKGKPIRIWKLRSMYKDSQKRLEILLENNIESAAEWYARYKLQNDPRILPFIGRFIRKYSIDELPQLYNVLKGDVTLVGPRVFVDYDLDAYSQEDLQLRQSVLPGITGLWQITIRSAGTNEDKIYYDRMYVQHRSFWLDLDILYRTVGVVLTGRGAV